MKSKTKDKSFYSRLKLFKIFFSFSFFIIVFYLSFLTIFDGDHYNLLLDKITNVYYEEEVAPRGRIYDRNYNLLVDNKKVPVINYLKPLKTTKSIEYDISYKLAQLLNINYSNLTSKMLKEFYMINNDTDYLITDEEWNLYDERKITIDDIYNYKLQRIDENIFLNYEDVDFEAAYIFNLLNNGSYYEIKTIKKNDLTDKEISLISDNLDYLPGIFIDYTYERDYLYGDTFRKILGNISNISYEDKNYYLSKGYDLSDLVGSSYIEKQYENFLRGKKGTYKIVDDTLLRINSSEIGKDIVLTIDINLQKEIEKILEEQLILSKNDPNTEMFNNVFVVIKNPVNGDILAMVGKGIRKDNGKYIVYDYTEGVLTYSVTPGSVVKGASMLVGYKYNAIKIGEKLNDTCVKVYSYPKKCSWKNLGLVDDIKALSLSSNIFQFKTAFKVANFNYSYNKKLTNVDNAFKKYRAFFNELGLGVKSGIDLPIDEIGSIGKSTSPDLYLNYVIGQYDTYTTMQLSEYISTIANNGIRVYPHLLLETRNNDNGNEIGSVYYKYESNSYKISVDKKYIDRVRLGFKEVMTSGLGKNYMGSISNNSSGKTGTSESFCDSNGDGIIDTSTISNAFVGYYPSDSPKMSIAIVFPNIMTLNDNNEYRSYANKIITRLISEKYKELYG